MIIGFERFDGFGDSGEVVIVKNDVVSIGDDSGDKFGINIHQS